MTKDTQIEGLADFAKGYGSFDATTVIFTLGNFRLMFKDPAIFAHIPAVKALQEENARLKATTCTMHELRVMTEAYAEQVRRIATLEAQLAAPAIKQQVPEAKPLPELMMASYHEAIGWNACRDAMLAATPTHPVSANQPDGGKDDPFLLKSMGVGAEGGK